MSFSLHLFSSKMSSPQDAIDILIDINFKLDKQGEILTKLSEIHKQEADARAKEEDAQKMLDFWVKKRNAWQPLVGSKQMVHYHIPQKNFSETVTYRAAYDVAFDQCRYYRDDIRSRRDQLRRLRLERDPLVAEEEAVKKELEALRLRLSEVSRVAFAPRNRAASQQREFDI